MPSTPPPPPDQQEQQKVWYSANCHCRLIRLRLRILPLYPSSPSPSSPSIPPSTTPAPSTSTPTTTEYSTPYNCNCSICTKNGYLNIYPTSHTHDIEWLSGRDELRSYEYGACERRHMFCPRCGSSVALFNFFDGRSREGRRPMVGVNVRMIEGIDIDRLTVRKADGWAKGEAYDAS